ncbi:TIGR01440 family protein [Bacillus pinisoli]|uniref:TIGR01440 family protein n=1 Tax=Bacillus pinisoli TaxID=2901866 RepID=UPI001FF3C239|nr:TIGR01440 family protein [Bacillus pinisoli]
MKHELDTLKEQLHQIISDFQTQTNLSHNKIVVIGCSTSEVIGERIGTAGTEEVAGLIFEELKVLASETKAHLAFQACEHINRALIVERSTAVQFSLEEVTVIPVRKAGGAMATYAYNHFADPVVVEFLKADAGIDIGDTFIGMHLKHVAVPIRGKLKELGSAHVTMATTRPKLIGGARAVYTQDDRNLSC